MVKKKISLLFLLVLLPLVSAVQIDSGTIIQSVGLNTTLNFTSTFYADVIQTESNSIYLEKFRTTSTVGEYITMNITNRNMTGFNAPYISASSSTSKTITSQLSQAINATVVVYTATCTFTATYNGNAVNAQSCINEVATFNLNNIPSGSSLLTLDYNPTSYDCNGSVSTLSSGITSFIPLAIVLMVMMIFASLGLFTFGDGISPTIKSTIYILTASTFVGLAIILSIGSIIVGSIPC